MVALYEAQPNGEQVELDPNAAPPAPEPEKKPEETPPGDKPPEPKEGDKPPADEGPKDLKSLFESKVYETELATDGKLSDKSIALLEAAGIPRALVDRMVSLEVANAQATAAKHDATLHEAAGGKAEFDGLVAWGKANLTAEQQTYFDEQLNGPFAAEAVALLKTKRGVVPPTEEALHVGGGGGAVATVGFKSEQELVAAMSDPRYQTDPAYRQTVARQLAVSRY